MDRKRGFDVYSCLLFEATGDSEVDLGPADEDDTGWEVSTPMAEDDAESCSDDCPDLHGVEGINGCHAHSCAGAVHDDDDDDDDNDYQVKGPQEEDGGVQMFETLSDGNNQMTAEKYKKSSAEVDSNKEIKSLNEMEKSRLFWEACLAS